MSNKPLIVSVSPHMHNGTSVKSVMWNVVIALIPVLVAGCYYFGYRTLTLTIYGIIAAVLTEAIILFFRKKPIVISDGSAVLTGMLITFNIGISCPWWLPVIGSVFAIAVGKHAFGGLGHNIMNPALLGRAFLMASWPSYIAGNWTATIKDSINGLPSSANLPDNITSATPLGVAKLMQDSNFIVEKLGEKATLMATQLTDYSTLYELFWGNIGGCIGEISAAAILLGALYMLIREIIDWRIPFFYIATVFILTWVFGGFDGIFSATVNVPIFHILSGGLLLGAFFMATDPVTTPVTQSGRIIFGIGCGIIVVTLRLTSALPEGVTYSILIMNLFTPLIDKFTYPKPFGEVKL
jgi:electron transport complex protein RnfD